MSFFISYQFVILSVLLVIGFGTVAWFFVRLKKKLDWLLGGSRKSDQGTELSHELIRRVAWLEAHRTETAPRIDLLESIAAVSVQKVGFLRFNPFHDTGGDNSFILVLLDRNNNGVLLSSLYIREGMRFYGKSVREGKSQQPISEEEKTVLDQTIARPAAQ